ncbi:DEAD/DEAH box helicase family protein [Candidatus Saccharibacteria bacterium]|nr:DEAD/DEAH box helicase family protein [Candidatus Saccharibacteria bacterium]
MIGDDRAIHGVDLLYASFQTMHRHRRRFRSDEFDYVVVDESHHGPAPTYLPTLEYFTPKFLLAITATPDRMDQQDIGEIFGDPIFRIELEDAWARGLLAPVDYRVMTDEWQNLEVLDTPIGKLSIKQLNKTIFATKRDEEIVRIIEGRIMHLFEPRVMIFCPRISHAEHIADLMEGATAIHSMLTSTEQEDRLNGFRDGKYRVVSTVDMFNEGINVPEANVIVFLRSTASRTIFFQQLGRGLRKSKTKKHVLVLDFVANCDRLLILDELRGGVNERLTKLRSRTPGGDTPIVIDSGDFIFDEAVRDVLKILASIRGRYSNEELIEIFRAKALELGRNPTGDDVDADPALPSRALYYKRFGNWSKLLRLVDLDAAFFRSDDRLIHELKKLADQLERAPSTKDVKDTHWMAAPKTYYQRFGKSWSEVLAKIGLTPARKFLSDKELLDKLRAKYQSWTEQFLTMANIDADSEMAHSSTYRERFGSLDSALLRAGVTEDIQVQHQKAVLTKRLKELGDRLGRTPGRRDVDKASDMADSSTYRKLFGSWNSALGTAGYPQIRVRRTPEMMLADLRMLVDKYGKLSQPIINSESGVASSSTYALKFGSIANAARLAGVEPNNSRIK